MDAVAYLAYALSIGVSDVIEFFTNPTVHRIHNAPDIAEVPWDEYGAWDAFKSGMVCTVPLLIISGIYLLFGIRPLKIGWIIVATITTPIVVWLTGIQIFDPFYGHKLLYMMGTIYFIAILMVHLLG